MLKGSEHQKIKLFLHDEVSWEDSRHSTNGNEKQLSIFTAVFFFTPLPNEENFEVQITAILPPWVSRRKLQVFAQNPLGGQKRSLIKGRRRGSRYAACNRLQLNHQKRFRGFLDSTSLTTPPSELLIVLNKRAS